MTDKLIRVSEETHQKLTDLGRKGETYEEIIVRLLKPNESWREILTLCREIKEILNLSPMYAVKHPFRTGAFQKIAHDISQRVEKIEQIAKGRGHES